jgi:hypothetical protein
MFPTDERTKCLNCDDIFKNSLLFDCNDCISLDDLNLRIRLIEFKSTLDVLNVKIKMSSRSIKDHCDSIRNRIQIKTESLIEEIENCSEILLKEVDAHENQCNDQIKDERKKIEKIHENCIDLFEKNKRNNEGSNIAEINSIFIENHRALKTLSESVDDLIIDQNKIKYDENETKMNSSQIGHLNYEKPFNFKNVCLKFSLKDKLASFKIFNRISVMENGNFAILYKDTWDSCIIALFDKFANLIISSDLLSIFNNESLVIKSIDSSNGIYILSFYETLTINDNESTKNYLSILNENLVIQKRVVSECLYKYICSDSENIIGLCDYHKNICIYDINLEHLKTVHGQPDCLLPYHFDFSDIHQIETMNKKIILRKNQRIKIFDFITGIEEAVIKVNAYQMMIGANDLYVVAYNKMFKFELQVYNLDGKLFNTYPISNFSNMSFLILNDKVQYLMKTTLELVK